MSRALKWIALAVAVFGVFSTASGRDYDDIDEEGILHVNDAWGLRVWGREEKVKSAKFPEQAPAKLLQTWRIEIYPDDAGAIKLSCKWINLPKLPTGECGEYTFNIKTDDGNSVTHCGSIQNLVLISKKFDMNLQTGSVSAGTVDCTARGIEVGPDGEEVTLPPTTTRPPRTTPKYLNLESEEIDSSEHGGPPGGKNTTCPCGWANKRGVRIIGGKHAEPHEYPFTVGVTTEGYSRSFCGGSIVSPYHIVTAAHCVKGETPGLQVAIAEHDFDEGDEKKWTKRVNVEKVIRHENYPSIGGHDIAILVLAEKLEFSQVVGPVCLPTSQLELAEQYVKAIGWGMTKPVGYSSAILKEVDLRVVPFETCAELISGIDVNHRKQICTYSKKQGIGRGDSGGPLVWLNPETNRYTLTGLMSFVYLYDYDKGSNYLPDVYTDVSSFTHWIIEQIRENKPEGYPCWAWDY